MIVKVNESRIEEITTLFEAYRRFYQQAPNQEQARAFLSERIKNEESIIFGYESDGKLIGFTQLYPSFSSTRMKRIWILNDLFVNPEYRGKGISKELIKAAKQLAIETDAAGLLLETAKTNTIGNQLYPATDFHLEADTNFYWWSAPSS